MMKCPLCLQAAHTRSSMQISDSTKERYNQCRNINCGCTFKSLETITIIISKPTTVNPVPPHTAPSQEQSNL